MSAKTLYIIDGHGQIYRAYYAPFAQLTSPSGEPTRATHVFMQMIAGLLRDKKPDYLAVALDTSDETVFRVQIDPTYKAHRQPPPEDLPPQIDRIVSILEVMKVPTLRVPGFEADDILATLCRRLAVDDLHVVLVSRDKDLDQLVTDRVRMYDPGKDRFLDAAAIIEEKGYSPAQAVQAQMLIGDSTDNVRGVNGVGPKKAAQLLAKYGSVAGVYEHLDEITPKLRESLVEFRERMEQVRQLVTLREDVPLDFDLSAAAVARFDVGAVLPIFEQLGFNRLREQFRELAGERTEGGEHRRPAGASRKLTASKSSNSPPTEAAAPPPRRRPAGSQGQLFGYDADAPGAAGDAVAQHGNFAPGHYTLVDTETALKDLAQKLTAAPAFAFDTETTGLTPATADLVGISLSFEAETGYYVPVRGVGRALDMDVVKRHLSKIFADPAIRKCGQNCKFDVGVLAAAGIDVHGLDFDTMLASFVLDSSRRSHGIDALAMDLLGFRKISTEALIGKGKSQTTFDKLPIDRVCQYACEDADIAWRLRDVLDKQLSDPELRALFEKVEMPLVDVLARMETAGVALDGDVLARLSNEMADRLEARRDDIHRAAGHPFNIDSTKQLAEVLFDERKLRVVKRTTTGRSTDAEVLEALAAESNDPIPKLVLEYRELAKLKGTYVDALPEMVSPRTGRIHPSFHQTGAVTGRLSCSDPNLQNIPIRTELGAQIRRAFVPGGKDQVLLKADYSQIELRVLAHFCGDQALAAAFHEDRDIHAFVASQIEGVPLEQVTKQQRANAKTVNFGIIYGQSAFGLARQTGMSQAAAKLFIERYFNRYPRIRGFLDECIAHAARHGYVKTILGRRRAIHDIRSRNLSARNAAERLAVNSVVQGSAADLIKVAMINIDRRLREEKRPSRMILQVHDELVFETPTSAVEGESAMIREEMSGAIKLAVPIKVDIASGVNWLDVA